MIIVPGNKTQVQVTDSQTEVDSAKAWVFNKSAELSDMNEKHTQESISAIDHKNYMEDISFMDGSSPNTYTNQKKNYMDTALASPQFVPPNAIAQELWGNYTNAYKQDQINKAIAVEIKPRITARVNLMTNGINLNTETISKDPSLYALKLEEFNAVMGEQNQYLPPNEAKQIKDSAMASYKNAYLDGMTKLDPGTLIDEIISGKHDELNDQQLFNRYSAAMSSYRITAERDLKVAYDLMKQEETALLENGGDISSSQLVNIDLKSLSGDEVLFKLSTMSGWQSGMKLSEMNGKSYLISNDSSIEESMKREDAIPVRDKAQGNRIIKRMSRIII